MILDGLNPEQRRAAEAVRGPVCILAGAGLGQDDHDHAADRVAGRERGGALGRRSSRSPSPTRPQARCARGLRGSGVDGVEARTFHSAALAQLAQRARRGAGPDPLDQSAAPAPDRELAARRRTASGPAGDLATEVEWAKNRRLTPQTYRDGLGRPRAADPGRPDGDASSASTSGARRTPARSTSRTCSSSRCGCTRRTSARVAALRERYLALHRRRVPGRQPAAAVAARALARRARRPLRGRRRLPVDLRLHGRLAGVAARAGRRGSRRRRSCGWRRTTARSPQVLALANRLVPRLGGAEKTLRATRPGRAGAGAARLRLARGRRARSCSSGCGRSPPRACRTRRWQC